MKIKSLFFLILILLTGCKSTPEENVETGTESISFLALGDSYTIGESVTEEERWPVQLATALRERGYAVEAPRIIAKTGWTTGDLLEAMDSELKDEKYDLVSILIGVNNQYQGKSIPEYKEELHEIFRRAIGASARGPEGVFVLSIPDYGATPFGADRAEEIGQEIDEFNAVFREVAQEYELPFHDITPVSREAVTDPALVAKDELHPSGKMYGAWVQQIVDEVAAQLPE